MPPFAYHKGRFDPGISYLCGCDFILQKEGGFCNHVKFIYDQTININYDQTININSFVIVINCYNNIVDPFLFMKSYII